jgi:hypothetical protein
MSWMKSPRRLVSDVPASLKTRSRIRKAALSYLKSTTSESSVEVRILEQIAHNMALIVIRLELDSCRFVFHNVSHEYL